MNIVDQLQAKLRYNNLINSENLLLQIPGYFNVSRLPELVMNHVSFNIVGAIGSPPLIMTVFLWLDEVLRKPFGAHIHYAMLSISLIIGIIFIARLPLSNVVKTLIIIPYFVGGFVGMIFYSLLFVCTVFGNCL